MATHEAALLTRAARVSRLHGIYVIVNEGPSDPVDVARAALRAGVRVVQYRAKSGIAAGRVRALRRLTAETEALLIMNDDVDAAIAYDCDGVHLGPDDAGFARVAVVRERMGERLVGLSCGTPAEARNAGDADYLGVGSVYATASKSDAGAPIGVPGLLAVARETRLPVVAIGGIDATNLHEIRDAGVAMAAVISAIANAPDAAAAARTLVDAWRRG